MALVLDSSVSLSWFFPDERTGFTDAALELAAEGSKACNRKVEVRPFLQ